MIDLLLQRVQESLILESFQTGQNMMCIFMKKDISRTPEGYIS